MPEEGGVRKAFCSITRKECSRGKGRRKGREREAPFQGREWKKSGSSQAAGSAWELLQGTILIIRAGLAELFRAASQFLWADVAV